MTVLEQVLIDMSVHVGGLLRNTEVTQDIDSRELNDLIYLSAKEFVETVPVDSEDYLGKVDQFIEQRFLIEYAK